MSVGTRLVSIAVLVALAPLSSSAEERPSSGEVSLPWQEFARLLETDQDEIVLSWSELEKILQQTGRRDLSPIQMADGRVVLTREQFRRLLEQMKPPAEATVTPPAPFLITGATYHGRVLEDAVAFRADLEVEIFPHLEDRYTKIPLFAHDVALEEVLLDGEPALVVLENGRHLVTTLRTGTHLVTVSFSVKTPAGTGRQAFSVPVPRTPITKLAVTFPSAEIDVEVAGAHHTEVARQPKSTLVTAHLAPTTTLAARWRKRLPEVERGPAKIYAETLNHLAIEDDVLRIRAEVALNVLQNSISSVTMRVPAQCSVLDVAGNGVGDWRELNKEGASFLEVPFDFPQQGALAITVTAEKLLPESNMAIDFAGFEVVDAIRDRGFVGIELKGPSEVTLSSAEGLDELDISELPATLIGSAVKPLLFGFKYLRHPYSLVLDITGHEQLPVIGTVIDSANGVTLFTEDGKLVHRVIYSVRNTSKQFLELELPADAQIWSVFVAAEPVKPRIHEHKVLVPLNRSRQGASGLVAFDVELIYFEKGERFARWGRRSSGFPVPDVIMSQVLWSVYLPVGYSYVGFDGTVEMERLAQGLRPLLTGNRTALPATPPPGDQDNAGAAAIHRQQIDQLKKQFSSNLALGDEQLGRQVQNEIQFSQRVQELQASPVAATAGMLPIRVQIPTTGQIFRFAKTIVSEEELTLRFSFVSDRVVGLGRGLGLVGLLAVLWAVRGRIARLIPAPQRGALTGTDVFLLLAAATTVPFSRPLAVTLATTLAARLAHTWYTRHRPQEPPPLP